MPTTFKDTSDKDFEKIHDSLELNFWIYLEAWTYID